MKNKKWITLVLALVLCAAMLIGCTPKSQAMNAAVPQMMPTEDFVQIFAASADLPTSALTDQSEAAVAPAETPSVQSVSIVNTAESSALCPICGDLDCDDGQYCDDAHEKAKNLEEYERLMNGDLCDICGDYDCDDGKYCDDAHEKAENLKEAEAKKDTLSGNSANTTPVKPSTDTTNATTSSLCSVCGDNDCDDGMYCDDADELAENLREAENRKNGVRCAICGDYDCDDGEYCDDGEDHHDD